MDDNFESSAPSERSGRPAALGADLRRVLGALVEGEPEARRLVAKALGERNEAQAVDALARALHDADGTVRVAAARALAGFEGVEEGAVSRAAVDDLVRALHDDNPVVRQSAAFAMAVFGDEGDAERIHDALSSEPDSRVREALAEALGAVGGPGAVFRLQAALSGDPAGGVRAAALRALTQSGGPGLQAALEAARDRDPDPDVRRHAVSALVELGVEDEWTAAALDRDTHRRVRQLAQVHERQHHEARADGAAEGANLDLTRRWPRPSSSRPRPRRGIRAAMLSSAVTMLVVAVLVGLLALPGRSPAVAVVAIGDDCAQFPTSPGPNHVVVAAVWSGEERRRFTKVLEQFTRTTGIEVTFATNTSNPDRPDRAIGATLDRLIKGGCRPDVALLPQPGLLRELAKDDALEPINHVAGDLVDRNYSPAWKSLGAEGDDVYGVWFKASNKSKFWYRTEAFAKAGVAAPRTWEELEDAAERLAAAGTTPFAIAAKDGWTLTDLFENIYLRTAGPDRYEELAKRRIPWTDATVKHALGRLAGIFARPEWIAGGVEGALETSYEDSVRLVFGDAPQAAMVFAADFAANEIATTSATVGVDALVFDFPSMVSPAGSGSTLVGQVTQAGSGGAAGGDVAVLFKGATHGGEALLRYLASPEAAKPWVIDGGFVSPNRSVDLGLYPDAVLRESAKALASADEVFFDLSDMQPVSFGSTPGRGMGELLRQLLRNPTDVDETAEHLEAERLVAGR